MFIERLNEALKNKEMNGSELCKVLKVSSANYTYWKTSYPRIKLLSEMADILDVSIDWLLERNENELLVQEEKELIYNFRKLEKKEQYKILGIIENKVSEQKQESSTLKNGKEEDNKVG